MAARAITVPVTTTGSKTTVAAAAVAAPVPTPVRAARVEDRAAAVADTGNSTSSAPNPLPSRVPKQALAPSTDRFRLSKVAGIPRPHPGRGSRHSRANGPVKVLAGVPAGSVPAVAVAVVPRAEKVRLTERE
jgi:hypothetical protein